ncbi:CHASE3 domain-containing protein [Longispora sp. NPDC051575]|uniref:sensor histidine kinase n=1 Tax=Longispora sp. NPDC051575 TaxID=3154943 RepID=UPI0034225289
MSTNALLAIGLGLMTVLLVAATVAGATALRRTGALTDQMLNELTPARIVSENLATAVINQESGLRGYALTGDEAFLEPFNAGVKAETDSLALLRTYLTARPAELAAVDTAGREAAGWRTQIAEPTLAAVRNGGAGVVSPAQLTDGKKRFDQTRQAIDALRERVRQARADLKAELEAAQAWENTVFQAVLVTFLLAGLATVLLIQRGVLRPLRRLEQATETVAAGRFDDEIAVTGPSDIVAVAARVDSMRRRIVEELAFTVGARSRLEEQAADLARSNAELEQFAYVASHDLQEPLRKVASFSQLLERRYGDQLDDRARQYIGFAVDGAQRMQVLINDLLAFSRVGRVYDDTEPVDLEAAFTQAVTDLGDRIERTDATITHDTLPVLPGDPTLLTMLWQNLLGNALKFAAPDRPPVVTVTSERDGDQWRFAVTDNGIGVPAEFAEKIFVIFQRLHARGDVYGGTGIGLAMCRKIVEHHGGSIGLDTGHVDGARFVFTLPAGQDPAPGRSTSEDKATASE